MIVRYHALAGLDGIAKQLDDIFISLDGKPPQLDGKPPQLDGILTLLDGKSSRLMITTAQKTSYSNN